MTTVVIEKTRAKRNYRCSNDITLLTPTKQYPQSAMRGGAELRSIVSICSKFKNNWYNLHQRFFISLKIDLAGRIQVLGLEFFIVFSKIHPTTELRLIIKIRGICQKSRII